MSAALARAFPSHHFPTFLAIVTVAVTMCEREPVNGFTVEELEGGRYRVEGSDWTALIRYTAATKWIFVHSAT